MAELISKPVGLTDTVTYLCTGVNRNGKRFKRSGENKMYIWSINAWRGSYWIVTNGKRKLSHRVYN